MILLLDIGNSRTHLGDADLGGVRRRTEFDTRSWFQPTAGQMVARFVGRRKVESVVVCSVVPRATSTVRRLTQEWLGEPCLELDHRTAACVLGIDYPQPQTIGPDRLANAIAARQLHGSPCVAVDFGTAVTFDVVNHKGCFAGGIIAPGLGLMTQYLHEKTALLPEIEIRPIQTYLGRSTNESMLAGAVHGFRGLVREVVQGLKRELGGRRVPVVATGGYAELMVSQVPEITALEPSLTLEGLRLLWMAQPGLPKAPTPRRFSLRQETVPDLTLRA